MSRKFTLSIIAALTCIAAIPQRSSWYSADMLTNNQIQCIAEDSQGFIWIGTELGLNKFDGYQFSFYFSDSRKEGTLVNNYVKCMKAGENGQIWVGTGRGLQILDPKSGELSMVPMPSGGMPFINQIEILSNGEVWFLAYGSGVCRIRNQSEPVVEEMADISKLTGNFQTVIKEDSHGILWIGTNQGVFQYNPISQSVTQFEAAVIDADITGICEDRTGDIFISTDTRIFKWVRSDDSLKEISRGRPWRNITKMFTDRNDIIYAAIMGDGVRYYDRESDRFLRYDDSGREPNIIRLDVSALFMDSKNNLWLGCYQDGLVLIPNGETLFKSYRLQDYRDLQGRNITYLMMDDKGFLWSGFNNYPVVRFSSDGELAATFQERPFASCLFQAADASIWAGLFNGDIARVDLQSGTFIESGHQNGNSPVHSIVQDKAGNIYYSNRGAGFSRYNPATGDFAHWSSVSDGDEDGVRLENDWISTLSIDSDGMMWVGHNTGISCFDTRTGRLVPLPSGIDISGNACNSILCDRSERIWFGTSNAGLAVYDKESGTMKWLATEDGLSSNMISGLLEDAAGDVWCSTRLGLNRIDSKTMEIGHFYSGSGILDKTYNVRACAEWNQGRMLYFGSRQGIIYFDPSAVVSGKDNVGRVVMTSFYINNTPVTQETVSGRRRVVSEPVPQSEEFHISYKERSITLEFSTFDYGYQDCVSYEYSFNQNQWSSTPAGVNRINITQLGPGRHTLKVRAVNNNKRSETGTYVIDVATPWYLSIMAIICYALFLCGIVLILYYNSRQHRERELSDAKLQTFTNIAHELCSPLTMLISPLDEMMKDDRIGGESKKSLMLMHRISSRIVNLVSQLLEIRKYDEGQMRLKCRETDLVSIVQNTYEMYMYNAGQHNIKYSYRHSTDELLVWVDSDRIEKVVTNLLSNAFKYTADGGEVSVEVNSGTDDSVRGPLHHYAEVSVTDTGVGLDVTEASNVFDRFYRGQSELSSLTLGLGIGLNYSRILVEMHKGVIKVENRGQLPGSRFWFRIPLGREHLRQDEIDMSPAAASPVTYQADSYVAEDTDEKQRVGAARGYKILVVDDDEALLEFICSNLRASYYKVISCRNGKEGLHLALSQKPDLIVSDVVMPEMNGIEFVKSLRNNPNISHIPFILLSARNEQEDRLNGIGNGADVYLPKPFYMKELKINIANLINNRLIVKGKFSGEQEQKDSVRKPEVKTSDEQLMSRMMDVINTNMSNPDFSVEMLADQVGVSRTQLHRKVKDMTGLSAGRFINGIKMRQAAVLLEQKGLNVSEVADMVGFGTRGHFATAFKAFYGVTPSEYIHEHENKDASGEMPDSPENP